MNQADSNHESVLVWPGRGSEADVLIAERVLGQVPCGEWRLLRAAPVQYVGGKCEHPERGCYPPGAPAHYSGNLRAAWQLLGWVRDRDPDAFDTMYETLAFDVFGTGGDRPSVFGLGPEEAAERVAIAALRACGYDVRVEEAAER